MPARLRGAVIKVYRGVCQFCGRGDAVCVDHIVPFTRGGEDDLVNLTLACKDCNTKKSNELLPEAYLGILVARAIRMKPKIEAILAAPRKRSWSTKRAIRSIAPQPITDRERIPTHPGELMREILNERVKISMSEVARRMEISRPALYAVLNGTGAVTPEMALRFARLVKGEPGLFVQMQTQRDLWLAAQRLKATLGHIEPVA